MQKASEDELLNAVDEVMSTGGYTAVEGNLTVSGVPFEVVRAYTSGPGFLDLVVVVDAREGTEAQLRRGYWLVERIASALDQSRSPRSLTAIVLHDASAARVPTEEFLRHGRVLLVTDVDTVAAELAPILPIVLEPSAEVGRDPLETLLSGVGPGGDAQQQTALIEAARLGSDRVRMTFVKWIDDAFSREGAEDDE